MMPMPASVVLSVAVSVALAASPPPVPRLILSLQKSGSGKLTVRVENASNQPLVLGGRTYLALSRGTPNAQGPVFWAEMNTETLPATSRPMRLAPKQKTDVRLDLRAALWSPDRTGLGGGQPMALGVLPGQYELHVQIIDERDASWRSGGIPITVSQGGGVAF